MPDPATTPSGTHSSSPRSDAPPPYGARRVAAIGGAAALGLGALYLGMVAFGHPDVPAGTTVLGVAIGGMSRDDAVAALTTGAAKQAGAELDVHLDRTRITLDPADAGLSLDAAATVASVTGRSWNPFTLLGGAGTEVDPVVAVDRAALTASITTIAADTDSPAQEPSIRLAGTTPRLTAGEPGRVLDRTAAADAVVAAYLRADSVVLPVLRADPTVSDEAAQAALAAARTAVSEPVRVQAETVTATLPPAAIAGALTYTPKDGALEPVLDGVRLRAAIAPEVAAIESPGRDATWRIRRGVPVVVPSRVGRGVNAEQLAGAVGGVLSRAGAGRTVTAPIGTIEPALTTEQATALGVKERLSTFTQSYPYAAYRSQNIGQAARYIDGTLLRPGDTFSMNDTIKERTVANGYTKGFIVGSGGVFQEALGGGVSTATTAMWTAAFFAGMERVHTQAHSIWISRYQAGLEATVAWGFFDMTFRNDTPNGVLITTRMTPTSITVSMWGSKVYDRIRDVSGPRTAIVPYRTIYNPAPTCHAQTGVAGFNIVVTREFIKGRKVVKSEPIKTHYVPTPLVLCRKDPAKVKPPKKPDDASPAPSSSAAPTPSPSEGT